MDFAEKFYKERHR